MYVVPKRLDNPTRCAHACAHEWKMLKAKCGLITEELSRRTFYTAAVINLCAISFNFSCNSYHRSAVSTCISSVRCRRPGHGSSDVCAAHARPEPSLFFAHAQRPPQSGLPRSACLLKLSQSLKQVQCSLKLLREAGALVEGRSIVCAK